MPDNCDSWDRISATYQQQRGWPHEFLAWGIRCPPERDLQVLGDVRGRRVLVLGCGGGQDCVAIARMGPAEVIGIDASETQMAHARELVRSTGTAVRLELGRIEDLSTIPSGSVDVVASVHVLTYVERVDRVLAEAHRVLVPSGRLAFSVHHPMDASTQDEPPYGSIKSYFQIATDWSWDSMGGQNATFCSHHRPVSDWFTLVRDAGFQVERMLEPRPIDGEPWTSSGWGEGPYYRKLDTIPGTLIVAARKP